MSTVKFNLKKSSDEATIFLIFNYGYYELSQEGTKVYKFLKLSTKEKIKISQWDYKNQRCKIMKGFPDAHEINYKLEKLKTEVISIHRTLSNNHKNVTPDMIKDHLNEKETKKVNNTINFVDYCKIFKKKADRSYQTKKKYQTLINKLTEYQESIFHVLTFEEINMDFYNEFMKWLKSKEYTTWIFRA